MRLTGYYSGRETAIRMLRPAAGARTRSGALAAANVVLIARDAVSARGQHSRSALAV
jgi:hypothetical protein